MSSRGSSRELRADLSDVVGRVAYGHECVALTRNGKVVADVNSYRGARGEVFRRGDGMCHEHMTRQADEWGKMGNMHKGERVRLGGLRATLLVMGGAIASVVATSVMVMQTVQGPYEYGPPTMSSWDLRHFWAAAVVLWAIQLGVLAVAWKFRSAPVGVIGSVALLAAIVMTSLLIAPFNRSDSPAIEQTADAPHVMCHTGSEDCPGG